MLLSQSSRRVGVGVAVGLIGYHYWGKLGDLISNPVNIPTVFVAFYEEANSGIPTSEAATAYILTLPPETQ
jgi:hypothetical protein